MPPSTYINTCQMLDDYFKAFSTATNKRLHLMFFMKPRDKQCQKMAPLFENLCERYTDVEFLTVDMQQCDGYYNNDMQIVKNIPAFLFYRNRQPIDCVEGLNPGVLEAKILRYAFCLTEFRGVVNLYKYIAFRARPRDEFPCMPGMSTMTPLINSITGDFAYESLYDPRIIISLAFTQPLDIIAITMDAPMSNGPKYVKLYANQPYMSISMENIATKPYITNLNLTTHHLDQGPFVDLRRFDALKHVFNLHIYVEDNQGTRVNTKINALQIWGMPSVVKDSIPRVRPCKDESYWMYHVNDTKLHYPLPLHEL